jgi:hypothetical protein
MQTRRRPGGGGRCCTSSKQDGETGVGGGGMLLHGGDGRHGWRRSLGRDAVGAATKFLHAKKGRGIAAGPALGDQAGSCGPK